MTFLRKNHILDKRHISVQHVCSDGEDLTLCISPCREELGKNINADEAAAMGAVYQAAALSKAFKVKPFLVRDAAIFPIQVSAGCPLPPPAGDTFKLQPSREPLEFSKSVADVFHFI